MSTMTRIDPAPSRLKYRLERLLLTPLFWLAVRVVLPFGLALGGATWWFSKDANRDAFLGVISDFRTQIETRPEFMVNLLAIDGASDGVAEDIRNLLPVDFPVSSFDLDLIDLRKTVMQLSAVKSASVRIEQGGLLQIAVVERIPAMIWRHADGLALMDAAGAFVRPLNSRLDRPDLPLMAGLGAEAAVPEALELIEAARPLEDRLRGLVRVGERRWDVVLDRDQRILLPESGAVQALERVIAMDQALGLLALDLAIVDVRLPGRPTVRLTQSAIETLRPATTETGEDTE